MFVYTRLHRFILLPEPGQFLEHASQLLFLFREVFSSFLIIFVNLRLNGIHLVKSGLGDLLGFQGVFFGGDVRLFHLADLLHQGFVVPL
jgi:hypothetical protein